MSTSTINDKEVVVGRPYAARSAILGRQTRTPTRITARRVYFRVAWRGEGYDSSCTHRQWATAVERAAGDELDFACGQGRR